MHTAVGYHLVFLDYTNQLLSKNNHTSYTLRKRELNKYECLGYTSTVFTLEYEITVRSSHFAEFSSNLGVTFTFLT